MFNRYTAWAYQRQAINIHRLVVFFTWTRRLLLTGLGVWTDTWSPPGVSPATYLADFGFLDSRVLAVHAVQCDGEELSRLAALGTTVVSCPRSSRHVGVGDPPLEAFYAMDIWIEAGEYRQV